MLAWWLALHLLLLATVAAVGWPLQAKSLPVLAIVVHAFLHRPRPTPRLVRQTDGRWALPERGLHDLSLGARTRYTALWVRLVLESTTGALDILLLADQLDPESWRGLQAWLRGSRPAAGASRTLHSGRW